MNREILKLAIPNIISNLSVPLLSLVDLSLMGHLESESYIGAISIAGVIFNFVFWGFGFLRMGTTGLVAQAWGARNLAACTQYLAQASLVALGIALSLILLQYPIAELSFYLISASPEVEGYAREYFYIRIYAAPATIGLYALTGWFLGLQDARAPMAIALVVNLMNVLLDYLFVYYFHMEVSGVAWATLLAQYLGLSLALGILIFKYGKFKRYLDWASVFRKADLFIFFQVNRDIMIRTLALIFTFSFFYAESAKLGDELLAVNSLLIQFNMLMAYGVDGFAFAAESLIGKYLGAKDLVKLKKAIALLLYWAAGLAGFFSMVYFVGSDYLLGLLTDQDKLLSLAQPYLFWIILAPWIQSWAFIWDGVYIGATASRSMRNSLLISTFLVFLPSYYLSQPFLGNHALWLAMTIFMLSRGFLLHFLAKSQIYAQIKEN